MSDTPKEYPAPAASKGPLLGTTKKDEGTRGELWTLTNQEVPREAIVTTPTYGQISNEIVNEGNTTRSRKKITAVASFIERCELKVEPSAFECDTTTCETTVPTGTPPTAATLLSKSSAVRDIDGVHAKRINVTVASYATLNGSATHPELGLVINEVRDIVAAGTAAGAAVAGEETMVTPIDCVKSEKIVRTLVGWEGFSLDLCDEINFSFPAVMIPGAHFTTSAVFLSQRRRTAFFLSSNRRDAFQKVVSARINVSFSATKPGTGTLYSIIPNHLIHDGLLFKVNERGVLNDAGSLVATTNSADVYYGYGNETFSYYASIPSASAYVAAIGTEKLISQSSKPWSFHLWRTEKVYITLE